MKKTLSILSALLLGLVSCTKTVFDEPKPQKAEETGLVAVTMKVQIPQVQLYATKALGDRSDQPSIKDIRVAVFGTSGYPQTYTLAEPINADGTPAAEYATENGVTYYFKVLLPVYEGEAHVHIIANGDESIKFVDEDEESIMTNMRTQDNVGAFWARIVMPDGILAQLDQNGIMQTDDEGNFIPSAETAHFFEDLVLVRNFAEVKLLNEVPDELHDITWALVNVPTLGSVAPMVDGEYVDDYKNYDLDPATGKMVNGTLTYDGFMFADDPMDYTVPAADAITTALSAPGFVYERVHPGTDKATCILMKAKYHSDGDFTYYRLDLTDENVGGYFPLYRNYLYQVKIHKVGNRGAKTPTEAMNRDSGGNVSLSTEAMKLTDISDGDSRLYVEYVEKNFTSGGKKGLWVQYVPNAKTGTVDNTSVTLTVKTQGDALIEGTEITKTAASSIDGYYFFEFELNEQNEERDLVSVLQVKADNGKTGEDKSTLFRDITLRVIKKMDMTLSLVPKKVDTGTGKSTVLGIQLPDNLPESMFPLEFYIEDVNHTLNPTQLDGEGNAVTVPVKTAKSLADGTTNSFYFIRTVNSDEYNANHKITTQFTTVSDESATTIYVANEYFKTQSINLLNGGLYVNPTNTTVPFSATSVDVEVEFDEDSQSRTWSVTGGSGVTVTPASGTGNGSFKMTFTANNSLSVVTRTATITSGSDSRTVTVTQSPVAFSISPVTQTITGFATTAKVKIYAEEGKAWTASVSGPNGTNPSLSATSGTGTTELTVTLPANGTANQRSFTVTARMTDPVATATSTIVQRRGLSSPASFAYNSFGINGNTHSGQATTADGYVTVSVANGNRNNNAYIRMSYSGNAGTITVTPQEGLRVTRVVITYQSGYVAQNPTVTTGSYSYSGTTGTWTLSATGPATLTCDNTGDNNGRRITNIQVTYEVAN